jgi:hypothetical protein
MSKDKKPYTKYVPKVWERATIYQLEMEEKDGVVSTWYYDKKKSPYGPYKTVNKYPSGYVTNQDTILPKTKQQYLNPKTGKEVSYARARNLGLV